MARRPTTARNIPSTVPIKAITSASPRTSCKHPPPAPADGPQDADLARPFEDRHEHRVEHADRAEDERDGGRRPGHGLGQADLGVALDVVASRGGGDAGDASTRFDAADSLMNLESEECCADQEPRDLSLLAHHLLKRLKRHDDSAVFKPAIALEDSHDLKWHAGDLQGIAGLLSRVSGQRPGRASRLSDRPP